MKPLYLFSCCNWATRTEEGILLAGCRSVSHRNNFSPAISRLQLHYFLNMIHHTMLILGHLSLRDLMTLFCDESEVVFSRSQIYGAIVGWWDRCVLGPAIFLFYCERVCIPVFNYISHFISKNMNLSKFLTSGKPFMSTKKKRYLRKLVNEVVILRLPAWNILSCHTSSIPSSWDHQKRMRHFDIWKSKES